VRRNLKRDTTTAGTGVTTLDPVLAVGTMVYVRDRYLGNWCSGFVVAEVLDSGYRLRRMTDHRVFPDLFPFDDVRPERRQNPRRESEGSWLDRRQFP